MSHSRFEGTHDGAEEAVMRRTRLIIAAGLLLALSGAAAEAKGL